MPTITAAVAYIPEMVASHPSADAGVLSDVRRAMEKRASERGMTVGGIHYERSEAGAIESNPSVSLAVFTAEAI